MEKKAMIDVGETVLPPKSAHGYGGSITVQAVCPHCAQSEQVTFVTADDVVSGLRAECRRYGTPYRLTFSVETLRIARELKAPEEVVADARAARLRSRAPTLRDMPPVAPPMSELEEAVARLAENSEG